MKKNVVILMTVIIALVMCRLSASDLFFANTDLKAGVSYSWEMEGNGFQIGSLSRFSGTNHRLGAELVWWYTDKTGVDIYRVADINFNYNYILVDTGWFRFYPLAVLGYHHRYWKSGTVSQNNSEVAYGLGAGIEIGMPRVDEYQWEVIRIYIEPRYFLNDDTKLQLSVGAYIRYPG